MDNANNRQKSRLIFRRCFFLPLEFVQQFLDKVVSGGLLARAREKQKCLHKDKSIDNMILYYIMIMICYKLSITLKNFYH